MGFEIILKVILSSFPVGITQPSKPKGHSLELNCPIPAGTATATLDNFVVVKCSSQTDTNCLK